MFGNRFHQQGKHLSSFGFFLRGADFQDVTWFALQSLANAFQRVEGDSLRFIFFQAPQGRVTDAGLLRQPIESSVLLTKQYIDVNSDHYTY